VRNGISERSAAPVNFSAEDGGTRLARNLFRPLRYCMAPHPIETLDNVGTLIIKSNTG
jgi:hypothetical protein